MTSFWKLWLEQSSGNLHFLVISLILLAISLLKPYFLIIYFFYLIYIFIKKDFPLFLKIFLVILNLFLLISFIAPINYPDSGQVKGLIVSKRANKIVLKSGFKSYLIYTKTDLLPGDYLEVEIKAKPPKEASYLGDFDEKLYLKSKYYFKSYELKNFNKLKHYNTLEYSKYKLLEFYEMKMPSDIFLLFKALVFGENNLNPENKEAMSRLNILHILALSGFHLALIYKASCFILKKITHRSFLSQKLGLAIILFYSVFCGLGISLLRALLFILFSFLNENHEDILTRLDIYSLTFILVLIKPLRIYDLGFILSFISSFGLLFLNDFIKNSESVKGRILSGVILLLMSFPFLTKLNNKLSLFALFSFCLMDIFGYIFIPFCFSLLIVPSFGNYFNLVYEAFLSFINKLSQGFLLSYPYMTFNISLLYYLSLGFILYSLSKKNFKLIMALPFILVLIFFKQSFKIETNYLEFIDVGQGDTLYLDINHKGILVDAFNVYDFLEKRDITKLEAIFITHSDNDHMGDLELILRNLAVKEVYTNMYDEGIDLICKKTKTPLIKLKGGDLITIAEAKFKVLSPYIDFKSKNTNSLVLDLEFLNHSFILMGDATTETEEYLINHNLLKRYDLLKVGHHGSITSTSLEFLELIRPKYAIISLGNNNYGMPNDLVTLRLKKYSQVYLTKDSGNIKFIGDRVKPYRNLCYN